MTGKPRGRKGGRRPLPPEERRSETITFQVTHAEKERLLYLASAHLMSPSAYCRMTTLQDPFDERNHS